MRNQFVTTLQLRRIDICDLLIACTLAGQIANDGGKKWQRLHDELKSQLDNLDTQLDEIEGTQETTSAPFQGENPFIAANWME